MSPEDVTCVYKIRIPALPALPRTYTQALPHAPLFGAGMGRSGLVEVHTILTLTPAYSRGCGVAPPTLHAPFMYSRERRVGGAIPCSLLQVGDMEWDPPLHVPYRYSRASRVGGDTPFPLIIEGTTVKQWLPPMRVEE